jgi:hypothetical protein
MLCCAAPRIVGFPSNLRLEIFVDAAREAQPIIVSHENDKFELSVCLACGQVGPVFSFQELSTLIQAAGEDQL